MDEKGRLEIYHAVEALGSSTRASEVSPDLTGSTECVRYLSVVACGRVETILNLLNEANLMYTEDGQNMNQSLPSLRVLAVEYSQTMPSGSSRIVFEDINTPS
jgi:hypothetical protein